MVITRRKALAGITAAGLGRIAWGDRRGSPGAPGDDSATPRAESNRAGNDTANVDLSHVGAHVYSEEGIAMFLGCENTAVIGISPEMEAKPLDLNRKVSSAFERYAQEWVRLHPHAKPRDAAKIVELLAGRDFKTGGMEASL